MNTPAWKSCVIAVFVGAAPPCAAGCSVLLSDPGGYYLADAGLDVHARSPEAAPDADTAASGGDGAGEDAGREGAPDDAGSVDDAPVDIDSHDAATPKCHSTQILLPTGSATVASPVHLVTTWDPCMSAILCYLNASQTPVTQTMTPADAGVGIDTMLDLAPGAYTLACSTFYNGGGGGQTTPTTFDVVGDASRD